MVVLLLIAAALAITAPAMSSAWKDARFRASSRTLCARLAYAHRKSIVKAAPVRVAFDKSRNSSRIEIMKSNGRFEPFRSAEANELPLPDGVAFGEISGPGADPAANRAYVVFFPDGTADARRITIRGRDGESVAITIHPATGLAAIE